MDRERVLVAVRAGQHAFMGACDDAYARFALARGEGAPYLKALKIYESALSKARKKWRDAIVAAAQEQAV